MTETPSPETEFVVSGLSELFAQWMQQSSSVDINVGPDLILITEDRACRILNGSLSRIQKRRQWSIPLGMPVSLLVVFPTTRFRSDFWKGAFILGKGMVIMWFLMSLWQSREPSSLKDFASSLIWYKSPTIEDVVGDIKRASIVAAVTPQAEGEDLLFPDDL